MKKIYKLKEDEINQRVKSVPGIYQIICYKKGKPLVIGRLLKEDKTGILSIGSSKKLKIRLKGFIDGMETGQGHSSGNRYYYLDLENKKNLGDYTLMFKFRKTRKYKKEESQFLIGYMKYFGELPPLNNQEPKTKHFNSLDGKKYPEQFNW